MTVSIRADVFPATVTLHHADGTTTAVDRVRVVVTATELLVFQDSSNGPAEAYRLPYTSFTEPKQAQRLREAWNPEFTTYIAETTGAATQVTFTKGSGCGCGSRLKSFNPFSSINSLNAP